jgi:hypothetical protein
VSTCLLNRFLDSSELAQVTPKHNLHFHGAVPRQRRLALQSTLMAGSIRARKRIARVSSIGACMPRPQTASLQVVCCSRTTRQVSFALRAKRLVCTTVSILRHQLSHQR